MTHPGAERLPAPPVCAVPGGAGRSAGLRGLSVHGILPAYKMNKMASAVSASADVPKKQESDEDDTKQA